MSTLYEISVCGLSLDSTHSRLNGTFLDFRSVLCLSPTLTIDDIPNRKPSWHLFNNSPLVPESCKAIPARYALPRHIWTSVSQHSHRFRKGNLHYRLFGSRFGWVPLRKGSLWKCRHGRCPLHVVRSLFVILRLSAEF